MAKMKAAVFVEPGRIVLDDKPVPEIGPLDALMRITTTTICGTDIHILKGEYPVERGLIIGHEPVGVIEKLGSAVQGYREGDRVIAGAITPSGYGMPVCATIIAVDAVPARMKTSRHLGADPCISFEEVDPVQENMRSTDGRGVDVAIEALGTQATFEAALRVLRPGGVLSSLGVYSSDLKITP